MPAQILINFLQQTQSPSLTNICLIKITAVAYFLFYPSLQNIQQWPTYGILVTIIRQQIMRILCAVGNRSYL